MCRVHTSCSDVSESRTPRRHSSTRCGAGAASACSSALIAVRNPARRERTPSITSGTVAAPSTRRRSKRRHGWCRNGGTGPLPTSSGGMARRYPREARPAKRALSSGPDPGNAPANAGAGMTWAAKSSRLAQARSGGSPPASGLKVTLPSGGTCSSRARTCSGVPTTNCGDALEVVDRLGLHARASSAGPGVWYDAYVCAS